MQAIFTFVIEAFTVSSFVLFSIAFITGFIQYECDLSIATVKPTESWVDAWDEWEAEQSVPAALMQEELPIAPTFTDVEGSVPASSYEAC